MEANFCLNVFEVVPRVVKDFYLLGSVAVNCQASCFLLTELTVFFSSCPQTFHSWGALIRPLLLSPPTEGKPQPSLGMQLIAQPHVQQEGKFKSLDPPVTVNKYKSRARHPCQLYCATSIHVLKESGLPHCQLAFP